MVNIVDKLKVQEEKDNKYITIKKLTFDFFTQLWSNFQDDDVLLILPKNSHERHRVSSYIENDYRVKIDRSSNTIYVYNEEDRPDALKLAEACERELNEGFTLRIEYWRRDQE